ncbi:MAG: helix-turn-helix domain-containing protein [Planctomycetota bacterium]
MDHGTNPFWSHLWSSLVAWLRPRVRPPIDFEDVAGETVLRAVDRLGPQPAHPWPVVWAWARSTAANLVALAARSARRLAFLPDLDQTLRRELAPPSPRAAALVDSIWKIASPPQRVLLHMADQGASMQSVARVLDISTRTVRRLRSDLAQQGRLRLGI